MPSIHVHTPSFLLVLCLCLYLCLRADPAVASPQQPFATSIQTGTTPLTFLDLTPYFINRGINDGYPANFDGIGDAYPASQLPQDNILSIAGLNFTFPSPSHSASPYDNIVALGQTLGLPPAHYSGLYLLTSSSYGDVQAKVTVTYADGTTSVTVVDSLDWRKSGPTVAIETDHFFRGDGGREDYPTYIHVSPVFVDPARVAVYFTLPLTHRVVDQYQSMHVWAASAQRAIVGRGHVNIVAVRSTTKQIKADNGLLYQAIEVTVQNIGTEWVTAMDSVWVKIEATGIETRVPGVIERLPPGQQSVVQIGIYTEKKKVKIGSKIVANVMAENSVRIVIVQTTITAGIPKWQPNDAYVYVCIVNDAAPNDTAPMGIVIVAAQISFSLFFYLFNFFFFLSSSLSQHESPAWFDRAKFGIFIHWGIFSVPAWGPVGKEYAEWYWRRMGNPDTATYSHHREHYGINRNYDDFIPEFTADQFNARTWLKLFKDAGAKYFVIVTKHHDGFALFESKVTNRTSWSLGPKRDFIKELFEAAEDYPELKRGLYCG